MLLYEQRVVCTSNTVPVVGAVRYVSKFDSSTVGTAVSGCSSFATIMNFYYHTMARVNIFEIVVVSLDILRVQCANRVQGTLTLFEKVV